MIVVCAIAWSSCGPNGKEKKPEGESLTAADSAAPGVSLEIFLRPSAFIDSMLVTESFLVGKDTVDIPKSKIKDFLKKEPKAIPISNVKFQDYSEVKLTKGKYDEAIPYDLFLHVSAEKNGKPYTGRYCEYEKDKAIALETFFRNGKVDGLTMTYRGYKNLEFTIHNNQLDGDVKTYFKNGKLENKVHYVHGIMSGISYKYFPSGKKRQESIFKNDEMNGLSIAYFETGVKENEGDYVNGKVNGKWSYYAEDGSLKGYIYYKDGLVVTQEKYVKAVK